MTQSVCNSDDNDDKDDHDNQTQCSIISKRGWAACHFGSFDFLKKKIIENQKGLIFCLTVFEIENA